MKQTDWDGYYSRPYITSGYSRRITSNKLIRLLKEFVPGSKNNLKIAELGGANSCFYRIINRELSPRKYLIVDNNQLGLDKTMQHLPDANNISLKNENVLESKTDQDKVDIVFSVGLIEHFSSADTRKCIAAHFDYLDENGICLIAFPTPTWLYKLTRKLAELTGLWIFYDERPLSMNEVLNEVEKYGVILHKSITWPIFLTQGVVLAVKDQRLIN